MEDSKDVFQVIDELEKNIRFISHLGDHSRGCIIRRSVLDNCDCGAFDANKKIHTLLEQLRSMYPEKK